LEIKPLKIQASYFPLRLFYGGTSFKQIVQKGNSMAEHIQVGDTTPRVQYIDNGTEVSFIYPFAIFEGADLEVYVGTDVQTLITDYTVSGAGQSTGGNVTFSVAPDSNALVTLRRNIKIERTSDFQQSGVLRAKVLNDELDRLTAEIQQVDERTGRSLHLKSFDVDAILELPDKISRSSKILAFDSGGQPTASSSTLTDIESGAVDARAYAEDALASKNSALQSKELATTAASDAEFFAIAASTSAAANLYSTIKNTTVDVTVTLTDDGTLFVIDTSGGDDNVTLPDIASDVLEGFRIGCMKSSALNILTVNRSGSDTINGGTSYIMTADTEFVTMIADDHSTDNWITFGASTTSAGTGLSKAGSTISRAGGVDIDTNGSISGHGTAFNTVTAASYPLSANDNGKIIVFDNPSAITVTLPQSTTNLPSGFQCTLFQKGNGQVSVTTEGSDTVLSKDNALALSDPGSAALVSKYSTGTPNTWLLIGDLA
jgi:hypothetical protein